MLLLLCAARLSTAEVALTPLFAAAKVNDLLEWHVVGVDPGVGIDPEAAPRLTIEGPDGAAVRSAFIYQTHQPAPGPEPEWQSAGPVELRIRHVVRKAGTWPWKLMTADGKTLAEGRLDVAPGAGPVGPIRVSERNARLLAFADGTPFIPIGPNIAWANAPDRLAGFERFFGRLQAAGGTHARVWMASWCGQVTGPAAADRRLDHAWLFDRILALARAHGLRLTVVLDNHHDLEHGKSVPYPGAPGLDGRESRLAAFLAVPLDAGWLAKTRYVLARWGADDTVMAWELCNEIDMAQPIRERTLPWVAAAAKALKRMDADRRPHLISWASTDDWERPMGLDGIDIVQLRGYVMEYEEAAGLMRLSTRDGVGLLEPQAARALKLGKPFLLGEGGFQGTNERNPGNDIDRQGLLLRQQAWAGFLSGGCGSGMNWWWDNYIDARDLWSVYRGLAAAVASIDWTDARLAPQPIGAEAGVIRVLGWQSPDQALLWPQPRTDTWYAHLVQGQPRPMIGQEIRIRLGGMRANATYRVTWLDMATGTDLGQTSVTAAGDGSLDVPVLPRHLDVVVVVRKP